MTVFRNVHVRPGSAARLLQALDTSTQHVRLSPAGLWTTEVGVLNQIVQLWDLHDTDRLPGWSTSELADILQQDVRVLTPLPFSPPLTPGSYGKLYELRIYTYLCDDDSPLVEAWEARLGERGKLSPFIGAWKRTFGRQIEWVHLWAYQDAADRQRIRADAQQRGLWPPYRDPSIALLRQENALLIPAPHSNLR